MKGTRRSSRNAGARALVTHLHLAELDVVGGGGVELDWLAAGGRLELQLVVDGIALALHVQRELRRLLAHRAGHVEVEHLPARNSS
eukprot:2226297-Pyramimonas_sp.AAC.1